VNLLKQKALITVLLYCDLFYNLAKGILTILVKNELEFYYK